MPSYFHLRPGSPSLGVSSSHVGQTAQEVLKTALIVAEKVLDGLPIPGAKGAIGIVLEIISGIEVSDQRAQSELELNPISLTENNPQFGGHKGARTSITEVYRRRSCTVSG